MTENQQKYPVPFNHLTVRLAFIKEYLILMYGRNKHNHHHPTPQYLRSKIYPLYPSVSWEGWRIRFRAGAIKFQPLQSAGLLSWHAGFWGFPCSVYHQIIWPGILLPRLQDLELLGLQILVPAPKDKWNRPKPQTLFLGLQGLKGRGGRLSILRVRLSQSGSSKDAACSTANGKKLKYRRTKDLFSQK